MWPASPLHWNRLCAAMHCGFCALPVCGCCACHPVAAASSKPGRLIRCPARRLEELSAKEEERHETLLCVNRLWEELNASIGFIQFRCRLLLLASSAVP